MQEYTIYENENGKTIMVVNGKEYILSPQGNIPNAEWLIKLQLKANLFAQGQ
jgi:hypothetical protein